MAHFVITYDSAVMRRSETVSVFVPDCAADGASSIKTVLLLHGIADDHTAWSSLTSVEEYAAERKIALIMPSVGRSWYTDTASGENYFTFVSDELPRVIRGFFPQLSQDRKDTFAAGLSMGGYGAAKIALSRPDVFSGFASLSGALSFAHRDIDVTDEHRSIFGDIEKLSDLMGTKLDPFRLAADFAADHPGYAFPKAYITCGTEDRLIRESRDFANLLESQGIGFAYEETSGTHTWEVWNKSIRPALDYLLK